MKSTPGTDHHLGRAARMGLGVGYLYTLLEALKNLPFALKMYYLQPLTAILVSLAFNLALGVVCALLAAPLLRLRGGWAWHAAATALPISALLVLVPSSFTPLLGVDRSLAAALPPLAVLAALLARRPWRRRLTLAVATGLLVAAYVVPIRSAPGKWRSAPTTAAAPAGAPNVLLIVLDTVRADRLDLYGYERDTFPWLRDFAAEGAVFRRALSAAPWTLPSHGSMFTGLYPSVHGAHHERPFLAGSRTTLAEILHRHGWATLVMSANPWITRSSGLAQGFATEHPVWLSMLGPVTSLAYRVAWRLGWLANDHSGRAVADAWQRWLARWRGERPFFAFLNFVEPHIPYHQLPRDRLGAFADGASHAELVRASEEVAKADALGTLPSPEDAARMDAIYDAAIRYEADLVSRCVEALRARGLLDQTVVIVVSDHGHLLGEHGMYNHNRSVTEQLLAVPLVVRFPPRVPAGTVIEEPVTTAALLPTVLDLVGLPPTGGIHTRSFAPLFAGDAAAARSPLLAEAHKDPGGFVAPSFKALDDFNRLRVRYRALEHEGWKLVVDSTGRRWLFRPGDDPTESVDLAAENPQIAEELTAHLATLVEAYRLGPLAGERTGEPSAGEPTEDGEAGELDPAVKERLRALGYLG